MNDVAADSGRPSAASAVGDSAVAVVTGGASGIGEAIARRLGGRVQSRHRRSRRQPGGGCGHRNLCTRRTGIWQTGGHIGSGIRRGTVRVLTDDLGRCDVLVNNAGVASTAPLAEVELERWNSTIAINVTGALLTTQHAIPLMKKGSRGRVVNISSISGVRASAGRMAYGTSKAAMIGLTRQLAIELAADNITVNSVAPGPVDTATARAVHTEFTRASYVLREPTFVR
jgi:3-oxoacyl-[acyl-carrier protein] reductase